MQSGNIAVMGVWDRDRMDQIWGQACQQAGIDDSPPEGEGDKAIEAMRSIPPEKLLSLPALNVSPLHALLSVYHSHARISFPPLYSATQALPKALAESRSTATAFSRTTTSSPNPLLPQTGLS